MISSKKYMMMSIGLSAIFVMAIMPNNISSDGETKFYGSAEMTLYDVNGNEQFSQIVHNQLVDTGETFLLNQAFEQNTNPAVTADNLSIGTICVSQAGTITVADTEAASDFDGDNSAVTETNCEQDANGATISAGTAVIGPLNFEAVTNDNNIPVGTVTGIGVCQSTAAGTDYNDCANGGSGTGILFAVVDTSNVVLASGESVDVTYTFDISNSGT